MGNVLTQLPLFQATQRRLAIWYTLVTGLLLLIFATGFFLYVRGTLIERVDDTLNHVVEVVSRSLIISPDAPEPINWPVSFDRNPLATAALEEDHIDLEGFNAAGELAWSTLGDVLEIPLRPSRNPVTIITNPLAPPESRHWLRQITVTLRQKNQVIGYLRVSHPWFEVTRPSQELLVDLSLGLGAMVGLVAASGWFLSRLAMEPIWESYAYLKQFTADASHELRNPIALIQTNVQVALADPHPDRQAQQLQAVERITRRLGRLVDDLLFLARQDSGIVPLRLQLCALDGILMTVIGEQEIIAQARQITLDLEIADMEALNPNPNDEPFTLQGDEDQLLRLFTNLISNAIVHSPPSGCIQMQLTQEAQSYRVTIQDQGPGIPSESLPRIFDRFFRLKPTQSEGTGLGLAIAQAIVHNHQGKIQVKSGINQGTTFTVSLPRTN
ncbi:HAMP domain-containing sensor histidine kinase [Thermosynechococcaceae cyanobacterium BACA0444]|uniref:histidine kinase n=1 Tax=Pseudocalidococcus azoricus BACA0444 TaxID=2918990 RepID=A0AAE4FQA2_9CYAN|nr:HAMP domain-containing sensor histidine kinase [Pseudocalidococcus azoricus]MDS3860238.1 HAMP domain-containing sensor histidine kinase [Pseudocalidococcus azoricus BACA0444]